MPRYEGEIRPEDNTTAHIRGRIYEDYPELFLSGDGEIKEPNDAARDLMKMNREELLALEEELKKRSR